MKISELVKGIEVLRLVGDANVEVTDIQFDSRRVGEGCLFVAQVGTAADGHAYIEQCVAKGAVAVVLEKEEYIKEDGVCYILVKNSDEALGRMAHYWYGEPSKQLKLVGVTGTNGKTTTATLLYKLFRALGYKAGLLSTVVNYVNDEAVAATHTTPNALELNALLAKMVAAGCTHAFMEVSSHAIAQERIAGLEYVGALFSNLTRDHLDYHKTFDNYRDTKKLLFDRLGKNAFAITNIDDKNGLVMTQNCRARVLTYSTHSMADFRGKILEEGFDGMLLRVQSTLGAVNTEVFVPMVGRFNVSNLLLIYGAAVALGEDAMEVLRIMSGLQPVNGRFETIRSPKGWTAVIDYAHTPDGLRNILSAVREIASGKIILVFGCGGDRDKSKRAEMGKIAGEFANYSVVTSDNPRTENPLLIINDVLCGMEKAKARIAVIENRGQAIEFALSKAKKGDTVLLAGKGHETYQLIGEEKIPFDEREIINEYFGRKQ